jgi:hypothetical protein
MKRHLLIIGFTLLSTFVLTGIAGAQQNDVSKSFTLRIGAPVTVPANETLGAVMVIGDAVTIEGQVKSLIVINGSARVNGTVTEDIVLIKGAAELGPGAQVGKDVLLYRSTLTRSSAAHIAGVVHQETGASFGAQALWFFWMSITIGLIGAGLLLAYFSGERLLVVADSLGSNWGGILVTTLFIVLGIPVAGILSFMTGIGFVFGFFLLFALIPMLALAGYVIVGTALGRWILGVRGERRKNLYAAVTVGILAMQIAGVIPAVGAFVVLIASQIGAGALVYRRWRNWRGLPAQRGLIIQPA